MLCPFYRRVCWDTEKFIDLARTEQPVVVEPLLTQPQASIYLSAKSELNFLDPFCAQPTSFQTQLSVYMLMIGFSLLRSKTHQLGLNDSKVQDKSKLNHHNAKCILNLLLSPLRENGRWDEEWILLSTSLVVRKKTGEFNSPAWPSFKRRATTDALENQWHISDA